MSAQYIAFDIGGMRFRSGIVNEAGSVSQPVIFESPANPDEVVEHIQRIAESYSVSAPQAPVGIAIGGIVEKSGLVTAGSINMVDFPLAEKLALNRTVAVINDAKAAALAEIRFNPRLADKKSFVLMTVSAGIGGGMVINGDLYEGHAGIAGEVGHMIIDRGLDSYCLLGHRGCLDALASGRAVKNRMKKLWREGHWSHLESGIGLREFKELLADGDGMAQCLAHETGGWIGAGIMNVIRVVDPCEIVFKGYLMTELWDYIIPHIKSVLASYERTIPMSLSSLGEHVGLVGAAIAAKRLASDLVQA
ncbi:MAG: ROK family protein [Armatimonadota bacterium]